MGAHIAICRTRALHDSNSWPLSLEFSLAAILPSDPCDLRGGGASWHRLPTDECGQDAGATSRLDGACSRAFDSHCNVYLAFNWLVTFSPHLDRCWARGILCAFGDCR